MTRTFPTSARRLFYFLFILFLSQHAVFAQDKGAAVAQDHASKIQEVLSLAHKYRLFNGSALVARCRGESDGRSAQSRRERD